MARHSGGRSWYGKLVGAALGVTVLAAGASVWTAQAGPKSDAPPKASKPAAPRSVVKPVSVTIVHASDAGPRGVNITIDDGPDPIWTPRVLDVLKEYGVKATFCMVGTQAQAHPDLVKKVVADGHRLCNHSVSHDTAMDKASQAYQKQQILDAELTRLRFAPSAPGPGAFAPRLEVAGACGRSANATTARRRPAAIVAAQRDSPRPDRLPRRASTAPASPLAGSCRAQGAGLAPAGPSRPRRRRGARRAAGTPWPP
ncbi:polysaccharide deacetylase family protein [Streptomyces narbonensis]